MAKARAELLLTAQAPSLAVFPEDLGCSGVILTFL